MGDLHFVDIRITNPTCVVKYIKIFVYTAQKTMEGTEFYDVTFAVEDDKEISIVLELNLENSAVVVIDEVLEPTRDTLARDEVEGSLPRLLLKKMLVKILSSTKGGILITSCTIY